MNRFSKDILYISSIRWDYSWHRQQEMMTKFAERGFRILFVQPCRGRTPGEEIPREAAANIWLIAPPGLPWERCLYGVHRINSSLADRAVRQAMRQLHFSNPIVWIDRIHGFPYSSYIRSHFSVYDLIDEITAFGRIRNNWLLLGMENQVLRRADLLLSSSQTLLNRKLTQSRRRGPHLFIPNGVDTRRFASIPSESTAPEGGKPVMGFIGNISRRSIDLEMITRLALRRPDWQFVFVGPCERTVKSHLQANGILVRDPVEGQEIPLVIHRFDVGLIPYITSGSGMDYVFPRKAFEYLAAGKPAVSTKLPEMAPFAPYITCCEGIDEFERGIADALTKTSFSFIQARKDWVRKYDWSALIREILALLERRE